MCDYCDNDTEVLYNCPLCTGQMCIWCIQITFICPGCKVQQANLKKPKLKQTEAQTE